MNPKSNSKWRGLPALAAITLLTACGLFLSAGQTFALGPQCTAPYVNIPGTLIAPSPDPTGELTFQSIHIGEPFISCSNKSLTVVIKVNTLDPGNSGMVTPSPNTEWEAEFVIPGTANSSGLPQTIFVSWDTEIIPTGAFNFGFVDNSPTGGGLYTSQCTPGLGTCAATGTVNPNGTITINLNMTSTLTFNGQTAVAFTMPALPAGTQLTSVAANTFVCACAAGNGLLFNEGGFLADGPYTVLGNLSCSNPPVAALSAMPTMGNAPLMVNFDASASNIPAGGCGTINSYIFDFGDASSATQPTPTVSHTYTSAGSYTARVRVTSTVGLTSSNVADANITVNSAGPPAIGSIVSRMTHGAAGDFDIVLPQLPATRNIECRSGGVSNNFKMVFTFVNNLVSVASASVTAGAGSVSSSTLGPLANQYTVNLTGVTNGQSTAVTLHNALDSIGAFGDEPPAIIGVLLGDATNNGSVNSSDISQTKGQSGTIASASNFRTDVTVNGSINSSDISTVKSKSGTSLP